MQSTVCFDRATSNAFPVSSGVKQGCVLAPTLFRIFFSMLLQYAFVDCTEGVYGRTRPDEVRERAGSLSMPSLLIQRRLRWLGQAHRMEPGRLPRETLYGELWESARRVGRPLLRYKDVIKRDLRSALIDTTAWEDIAKHRDT